MQRDEAAAIDPSTNKPSSVEMQRDEATAIDPVDVRRLALRMIKDDSLSIFRRFDEANLINLLYLQNEIQEMIEKFTKLCPDDATNRDNGTPGYMLASYTLRGGANPVNKKDEESKKRDEVMAQIRSKMKEYNQALLEVAQIRNLDTPDSANIARLKRFLSSKQGWKDVPSLSQACWDVEHEDDLIVLKSEAPQHSRVLGWIRFLFDVIRWELWGNRKVPPTTEISAITVSEKPRPVSRKKLAKRAAFASRLLMALFGGVALIVPTVIMVKVGSTNSVNTSLITTSVATVIFALVLAFGATDSTGKDVLAATAAYTAVLVVFIGTSVSGPLPQPSST